MTMKYTTTQVLKLLIEGEEEFSISKLSRRSGLDYDRVIKHSTVEQIVGCE